MMMDPAMRHLSGTWMGAFYTQEINKINHKKSKKSLKITPRNVESKTKKVKTKIKINSR
jgi:hypothetical protein|tara:strand:+ start:216 stop:392 length:177 start_codon:yes stop_codon:yes gene_type:complete